MCLEMLQLYTETGLDSSAHTNRYVILAVASSVSMEREFGLNYVSEAAKDKFWWKQSML